MKWNIEDNLELMRLGKLPGKEGIEEIAKVTANYFRMVEYVKKTEKAYEDNGYATITIKQALGMFKQFIIKEDDEK